MGVQAGREEGALSRFEAACQETERTAAALAEAMRAAERAAVALRKAARVGDHGRIQAALAQVHRLHAGLEAVARRATGAWPFDDLQLAAYLEHDYESDLVQAAREAGVEIRRLDDRLVAFPAVIRVLPGARAVSVDRKRSTALRPTHVVDAIQARRRAAGAKPAQFIEILYRSYQRAASTTDVGARLVDLHELLTLHPETRKAYSLAEFTRDVFALDSSGVRETRAGARISFVASTGAKAGRGVLVAFDERGIPKHYFGVRFEEPPP
jgi:hypothetical protein